MEIVTGVHQLRIPFPSGIDRFTNAYVIEGAKGSILVDCGWDYSEAIWAFREELRIARLSFEDIKWVVVTHLHPEHLGLAAKLRELCGAKILMHEADANLIHPRYVEYRELIAATGLMLQEDAVPEAEIAEMRDASIWATQFVTEVEPDILIDDGDTVSNGTFQLEVMHTPGHTPGHICLYDQRKRRLFCGDAVLFESIPNVGLHPQSGPDPFGIYLQSLEYLRSRPVSLVFPGHGPVFNSLLIRTEEMLRSFAVRQQHVLAILDDGLKTAYELASALPWKMSDAESAYQELSPRDRRAAIFETAALLHYLKGNGLIMSLQQDERTVYMAKQ